MPVRRWATSARRRAHNWRTGNEKNIVKKMVSKVEKHTLSSKEIEDISNDILPKLIAKQSLPPLLLIPLVENAFKHGVSETRGNPFVDVHLSIKNRQLIFVVKNSIESDGEGRTVKENIGLSNLRRQLELLYTDYNLSVQPSASIFTAILKINLASHV